MVLGLLVRPQLILVALNRVVSLFVLFLEALDVEGKVSRVMLHQAFQGLWHLEDGFEEVCDMKDCAVDVGVQGAEATDATLFSRGTDDFVLEAGYEGDLSNVVVYKRREFLDPLLWGGLQLDQAVLFVKH